MPLLKPAGLRANVKYRPDLPDERGYCNHWGRPSAHGKKYRTAKEKVDIEYETVL